MSVQADTPVSIWPLVEVNTLLFDVWTINQSVNLGQINLSLERREKKDLYIPTLMLVVAGSLLPPLALIQA